MRSNYREVFTILFIGKDGQEGLDAELRESQLLSQLSWIQDKIMRGQWLN